MKPSLNTRCLRPIYLIASLCLPLFGLSPVVAGTRDPLISDPVRPGLDYRMEVSEGYLIVYSATDRVDDGGVHIIRTAPTPYTHLRESWLKLL